MGEGIGKLYVDKKASKEQVKAIEEITSGKHGGGVFYNFSQYTENNIADGDHKH